MHLPTYTHTNKVIVMHIYLIVDIYWQLMWLKMLSNGITSCNHIDEYVMFTLVHLITFLFFAKTHLHFTTC